MYFTVGPYLIVAVMCGGEPVWLWTPAALAPGFWAGGFDPQS
ncbi:hypothetical protein [Falsigemmobacter faecalis]|nr:hypothetical protein [Falsigemmobacter faecalis]